ncbi:YqzK family protein [Caldibacillus lycopersici]|uniref:YqzK family protein n=1 Tax=Perspicuibacillus lycopersici TaxID=1325689 RepID=A0AAE3IVQ3_9BACI|nr:YqzK family protein [Perspicuibacillus lycopersici]MCU9613769.1 YqzK family protein [Perspicuibacillus lycopersici]
MKNSIKLIFKTLKVFLLFTGCTILFYYAIMWVTQEYQDYHRYDEPDGKAISVVSDGANENYHWYNRLLLFYLDGE